MSRFGPHRSSREPSRPLALALIAAAALLLAGAGSKQAFRLPGLESGALSSADLSKGKFVAVVWNPGSPDCKDIVSRVNRLVGTWSQQARVVTIVPREPPAGLRKFLAGSDLKAPVYLDADGAFSAVYPIDHRPGLLLFKDGGLSFSGKLPIDPDPIIERGLS